MKICSDKKIGELSLSAGRMKNNYGCFANLIMIIYIFAEALSRNFNIDLILILIVCFFGFLIVFALVWIFDFKKIGLAGKEYDVILKTSNEWNLLKTDLERIERKIDLKK